MVCRWVWLYFLLSLSAFVWAVPRIGLGGTKWATAEEEAQDEKMDPQLFKAVMDSISRYDAEHHHLKTTTNITRLRRDTEAEDQEPVEGPEGQEAAAKKVCYPEVGCFREAGYLVDMVPRPPEEVATRFLLYSSRHSRRADTPLLDVAFTNMSAVFDWADKAFNVTAPTKVIVHGFGSSCSHVWVYEMRSALMTVEDCNVVCVDWEKGAAMPNYPRAAANTRLVGRQLSILLSRLNSRLGLDLSKVHLIGFSLGAHAVAFAGASLPNKYTINRITGLDPAGPLFESQKPDARLDPSDARFVDVIHSNADAPYRGGLGFRDPMGHVDFYPNGGSMQTGCSNIIVGAVRDILSGGEAEGRSLCNHRRAYKFFTDSVSPHCRFPSVPCSSYEAFLEGRCFPCPEPESCPSMGYYADSTKARGALYLVTRQEEPFCANHVYMVRVTSSAAGAANPEKTCGHLELVLIGDDPNINETFPLTQSTYENLPAGGEVSAMVVPHPVLEELRGAVLRYTAYSPWFSSLSSCVGHPTWAIDSLTLTDFYGGVISACRSELVLESEVGILVELVKGDCTKSSITTALPSLVTLRPESSALRKNISQAPITQIVYAGDEWEDSSGEDSYLHTNNNQLDSEGALSGQNSGIFRRPKKQSTGGEQSPPETTSSSAVVEDMGAANATTRVVKAAEPYQFEEVDEPAKNLSPPQLNAKSWWQHSLQEDKKIKKLDSQLDPLEEDGSGSAPLPEDLVKKRGVASEDTSGMGGWRLRSLTVQLLPERLLAFIEQAEKYARLAFSPFLGWGAEEATTIRMLRAEDGQNRRWRSDKRRQRRKHRQNSMPEVTPLKHKAPEAKYIPLERIQADNSNQTKVKQEFYIPQEMKEHMEQPVPPQHTEYHQQEPKNTTAVATSTTLAPPKPLEIGPR